MKKGGALNDESFYFMVLRNGAVPDFGLFQGVKIFSGVTSNPGG